MKTTKRALFSSVIALILCFSMLVGTTFAWFTDSVESGVNKIIAGTLDIELFHTNESVKNDDVAGETALFVDKNGKPIKWEPGAVAYEVLTVENKGTLALKYQLSVNFTNENTVNGYGLSQILKIAVVDASKLTSREAALAEAKAATNAATLRDFTLPGELDATTHTSDTYGIVIWWEPSVNDNNYNVNNGKTTSDGEKFLHIDLGIKLLATQLTAEDDSFDNKYDEDAIYYDALVKNDAELLAAIQDPEVKVIAIDENVTYDWGGESYANSKALLMAGKTFYGVDGDETITFAGYGSANPIVDVALKDITVKDTTVGDNEAAWEHGHLEFESLTANNVVFANSIMLNGDCTLTNCSMNNQIESWYGLWIEGGNTVIRNCSFTGTRAIKVHEANGSEVGYVVIDNNEFVSLSEKPGVAIGTVNAATSITLTNNLFAGTQPGDQGNNKYESDTAVTNFNFVDENNNVIEKGATNSEQLKNALTDGDDTIYLPAGNYTFPGNKLSKGDVIICDEDAVFEGNSKLNINGATVIGATFSNPTGTAADQTINGTFKNCTFTGKNALRWCYGGDMVVFENCVFNATSVYAIHFDGLTGKNVSFINCEITGWVAIAGGANSVTFDGCTINGNGTYGLIRSYSNATIKNCTFDVDNVNTTDVYQDGIHAVDCTVTVENCTNVNGKTEELFNISKDNGEIVYEGVTYVATAGQLAAVVAKGATDIYLLDGEYNVANCGGKTLTLTGSKNAVLKVMNEGEDGCDYGFGGPAGVGNITFNGLTIDTTANTGNYKGYAYMKGTFNDCNFVGAYSLNNANDFVFNRCTFDFKNGYFWTWGANSVTFDGCTFNGNSKNILAHGYASTVININNCTFAATEKGYAGGGLYWTAAVEIDPAGSNTYTIKFTGENTITDAYAGWTRVKDGSTGHIITGLN